MSTDLIAFLGVLVTFIVGIPGFLAYRAAARLKQERDSSDRRTVDQSAFDKVTARQEADIESARREAQEARREVTEMRRERTADRILTSHLVDYVLSLRRTMMQHVGPGPIDPGPIPEQLEEALLGLPPNPNGGQS